MSAVSLHWRRRSGSAGRRSCLPSPAWIPPSWNTPPKNRHAASQPATIASSVGPNVNHTNMCREYTAVKINACTTRRRPVSGSWIKPILAKSMWRSTQ